MAAAGHIAAARSSGVTRCSIVTPATARRPPARPGAARRRIFQPPRRRPHVGADRRRGPAHLRPRDLDAPSRPSAASRTRAARDPASDRVADARRAAPAPHRCRAVDSAATAFSCFSEDAYHTVTLLLQLPAAPLPASSYALPPAPRASRLPPQRTILTGVLDDTCALALSRGSGRGPFALDDRVLRPSRRRSAARWSDAERGSRASTWSGSAGR